jgi:homoserine kinase type II
VAYDGRVITRELHAIAEIAGQFGIRPLAVEAVPGGRVNQHWRVAAGEHAFYLRRYRPERSRAAVAWEHALLGHAAAKDWPVALPHAPGIVESDGGLFALFPALEGEPPHATSPGQQHIHGRLLARLHGDLASFEAAQRPGFGRAWELDVFVQAAGEESFNTLLSRFANQHRELASVIRGEKYRNLRELARLGYGELPDITIHADFHAENLLFSGGQLTGLLDFDLARRDAAMAGIANAVALGCLDSSGAIDPVQAAAFLAGYAGGRQYSDQEAKLLVPLIRAAHLWLVTFRLLQWRSEEYSRRALAGIQRSVDVRFPALLARAPQLERAALDAR